MRSNIDGKDLSLSRVGIALAILLAVLVAFVSALPVKVIYDSDIGPDVDDAGAAAVLNALADLGEVEIIGMGCSTSSPWGPACLDAINTYYGRPNIPIGGVTHKSNYGHGSAYNQQIAQNFPNDLAGKPIRAAYEVYREVLAAQPDNSVVFVVVGFKDNVSMLLQSGADGYSNLSGTDLVAQKVSLLVDMGGRFPNGSEFNFGSYAPWGDPAAAKYMCDNWPTPIVFSGYEIGVNICTGASLANTPTDNPVREAYRLYGGSVGACRSSWDLTAAYYAVRKPASDVWDIVTNGWCDVNGSNGYNLWRTTDGGARDHSYLTQKMALGGVVAVINDLLDNPPGPAGPSVSITETNFTVGVGDGGVSLTAEIANPEGGETITWSVVEGPGSVSPETGTSTTFTPSGEGTSIIKASIAGDKSATATINVVDWTTYHVKINCGGTAVSGTDWVDDGPYVTGGSDFGWGQTTDPSGVTNAGPAEIYATVRHMSPHSYTFPVPDGDYTVRMHFVDLLPSLERSVTYRIEGVAVETAVGIPQAVTVKEYEVAVSDDNGLTIECEGVGGSDVFESGVEVLYKVTVPVLDRSSSLQVDGLRIKALSDSRYSIEMRKAGNIEIVGVSGRVVQSLGSDNAVHVWDATNVPSGAYLIRAISADGVFTKRLVLNR